MIIKTLLIAKSRMSLTICEEFSLPAVNQIVYIVLHKPACDIIKRIPLSNNTVRKRIDEMAQSVENSLCDYLKTSEFSIQLRGEYSQFPNLSKLQNCESEKKIVKIYLHDISLSS